MQTIKKILFPIFSIFLIFRIYELVHGVCYSTPDDFNSLETFFIAFVFTLFVTGVFAFPGFVFATNKLLPNSYYTIRSPKLLLRIYYILQVNSFRILLIFFFWGNKSKKAQYFNGTKNGLDNFVYQAKQSEFGHFGAFMVILLISILFLYKGYTLLAIISTIINIIGNLYPVILQRFHRFRIEKVHKRQLS